MSKRKRYPHVPRLICSPGQRVTFMGQHSRESSPLSGCDRGVGDCAKRPEVLPRPDCKHIIQLVTHDHHTKSLPEIGGERHGQVK